MSPSRKAREKRPDKLEFYRQGENQDGDWRWRVTAPNGQIVHASTEGYRRKVTAVRNLLRIGKVVQAYIESIRLPETP